MGDITLEAQEGIGNFGELFMAGGNITMSDTDGNLINSAKLISVDGDITLNASNGSVVNMLAGDVFALNGNVTFNAGAEADTNHSIYYVRVDQGEVITKEISNHSIGDRIVVTEKGADANDNAITNIKYIINHFSTMITCSNTYIIFI